MSVIARLLLNHGSPPVAIDLRKASTHAFHSNPTCAFRAMPGGRAYSRSRNNRVTPSSALKPNTYTSATIIIIIIISAVRVERPPQPKGSFEAERNRMSLASVTDLLNSGRLRGIVLIASCPMQGKGEAGGEGLARCNCGR